MLSIQVCVKNILLSVVRMKMAAPQLMGSQSLTQTQFIQGVWTVLISLSNAGGVTLQYTNVQ